MPNKATKKKVATLELDRSRWTGGALLECQDGQAAYCAVGGYLLALGIEGDKFKNRACIEEVYEGPDESFPEEGRWLFDDWNTKDSLRASNAAERIYAASDDQEEKEVIKIFKKHDIKVKFTGAYPDDD